MILAFSIYSFIYTMVFCFFFVISYLMVIATRLETLFKQGSTWQIRAAQIVISIIIASLATTAIMGLVNNIQTF